MIGKYAKHIVNIHDPGVPLIFEFFLVDSDRFRRDEYAYKGHSSGWAQNLKLDFFEIGICGPKISVCPATKFAQYYPYPPRNHLMTTIVGPTGSF